MGVPLRRQIYLGLPDGNLAGHGNQLAEHIGAIVDAIQPAHIYTTGPDGYDGHGDHIAVHAATLQAAAGEQTIWGLAADHQGALSVTGNTNRKLGALSFHASQRVTQDMTRWGDTDVYTPLIVGAETYNPVDGLCRVV